MILKRDTSTEGKPTSVEENVKLVRQYFQYLNEGNMDGLFSLFADDLKFWVSGIGTKTKEQLPEIFELFDPLIKGPVEITVVSITAQENRVSVETKSHIPLNSGVVYENVYHFMFVVKEGKISDVKEYTDPSLGWKAFFPDGPPPL